MLVGALLLPLGGLGIAARPATALSAISGHPAAVAPASLAACSVSFVAGAQAPLLDCTDFCGGKTSDWVEWLGEAGVEPTPGEIGAYMAGCVAGCLP